jgi:hypothetical protein
VTNCADPFEWHDGRKRVNITAQVLTQAMNQIDGCSACNPDGSEIPYFMVIRDVAGGADDSDYVLPVWGIPCPKCRSEIHSKTYVKVKGADAANWI